MRIRRLDVLAVLILILLWGLFSWRYLTPDQADRVTFPAGDFTYHFYVYRTFAYRELAAGRFPLWMDCVFAGYPFQADPQAALFYPAVMIDLGLHRLVGAATFSLAALQVEVLLHFLLASLLTYGFLRGEVQHRLAALLGAVTFAYGGYLTSYPPLQMAILEGAVWLPLALWGARGLAQRPTGWRYAAMVGGLSLSVLAGHPQTYVHVGYAVVIYYAYRCWRNGARWGLAVGRLALVGALAVGLSAVQLLPSLQFTRLSSRAEISFDESSTGFPLSDLVQLVLPGIVSLWQPLYVGIWSLVMSVVAALSSRHRDRVYWVGFGVAALLLSFGRNVFAFDAAYLMAPGYALFRGQERHAFLFSFAACVLAAQGSDVFLMPLSRSRRRLFRRTGRVLLVGAPVALLLLLLVVLSDVAGIGDWTCCPVAERLAGLFLILTATCIVLYGRRTLPRQRLAFGVLSLLLVVVDLYTVNRSANYAVPTDPYPPQPALDGALSDGAPFFRIQEDNRLPGHTACMSDLEEVYGMTPIRPERIDTFMRRVPEEVRWAVLGVRYVVSWRGGLLREDGAALPAEQIHSQGEPPDAAYTYRLPDEPRFAWVVHEVWTAQTQDELYALLSTPGFDARRVAVVVGDTPSVALPAGDAASVSVVERTPTRVRVRAELSSPGLLVLSQAMYPGWQAVLNGELAEVMEADGLLPAVVLPSGLSEVTFRYRPTAFWIGAGISATALLASLALVLVFGRRVRQG